MATITYTSHAEMKFEVLKRHGVIISRSIVEDAVENPQKVFDAPKGRKVAQAGYNSTHLIRVIYEETNGNITIITFYPARRERYEG